MQSYSLSIRKLFLAFVALVFIGLVPAQGFSADFEGDRDLFRNFEWPTAENEIKGNQNAGQSAPVEPVKKNENPSAFDSASSTEVTIQLEKKMPAMQGSGDKPFMVVPDSDEAYDDDSDESFEDDPFAAEKPDVPVLEDPLEGVNRAIYSFNDTIYDNLLRPVATTYRDVLHEEVRIAVRNIFNNALAPVKLVSSLVQLDLEKSGRVMGRTLINTVFGWGGMLDVAGQEYGIKDVNEDFNQALGYHGVGSGPYIVLPFLGPSTVRGVVGRVVDSFLSPALASAPGFAVGAALSGTRMVNDTSFHLDDIDQLRNDAIDPYASMRDFYHQYTEGQVQK